MEHAPILLLVLPLIGATVIPLTRFRFSNLFLTTSLLGSTFFSIIAFGQSLNVGTIRYNLGGWSPPWGIELIIDPLSGLFTTLVSGIGVLATFYSIPFLKEWTIQRAGVYRSIFCLLIVGLQGIVITGDFFNLYVFLEISSIAAYALLSTGGNKSALAVFRYLLIGTIAASFYLLGVGYLYALTGSLNMADVAARVAQLDNPLALVLATSLILIGLSIKSALFPLHGWLPDVYTYAPGPAVGFVAAIMTKISAYAIYRILYFVFDPQGLARETILLLGWAAIIAIVAASFMAFAQKDIQRMLAYSSVSQMGYIMLGISIGTPLALTATLLHSINHAIMKGCLFMAVNGIQWKFGIFRICDFGGIAKKLPFTMAAFTVAAISMIGIPPTGGFFSKYYLLLAAFETGHVVFVVGIIASSFFSAMYFFRVIENAYLLSSPSKNEIRDELPSAILAPVLILSAFVIILGLLNQSVIALIVAPGLPN